MSKGVRPQRLQDPLPTVGHPIHVRELRHTPESHPRDQNSGNYKEITQRDRLFPFYPDSGEHLLDNDRNSRPTGQSVNQPGQKRADKLPAHRSEVACVGPKALEHVSVVSGFPEQFASFWNAVILTATHSPVH